MLKKTALRSAFLTLFIPLMTMQAIAQVLTRTQIEQLSRKQALPALQQLREFLQLPNDGHYPDQIQANLDWCRKTFEQRQYAVHRIETAHAPLLLAERLYKPGGKTVLFYLQIDGQPVDPPQWEQPNPFVPVIKNRDAAGKWQLVEWPRLQQEFNPDWRIFARSASDSKGPAICFLAALDILEQQKLKPNFNIKVIMDFQEEMSSPGLPEAVKNNRELLAADMLVIMDGTRHVSNRPTLCFGARGIADITLKVFGPRTPMHSGQYGNFVPNPALRLAQLLAGMKDEQGRVTIPGFYDGIQLTPEEKTVINKDTEDLEKLKKQIGIAATDQIGGTYEEALQYPTLNIRGLQAAYVGEKATTIIPAVAIAELDIRLVAESDGERTIGLIKDYIRRQGYHFVEGQPTEAERAAHGKLISFSYEISYEAFRTDFDSPLGKWLHRAMLRAFPGEPVRMRTTGGSQPIAPFIRIMGIDAVSVRIPNPDNSIHAANENLRLGNFVEGIQSCLAVLTEKLE